MTTLPLARTLRQRLATAITTAATATANVTEQAHSWGWPGAVGLISAVAALTLGGVVLPALQADAASLDRAIDATELRAARLEARRRAAYLSAPVAAPLPAPQRFHDGFPAARERTQRLAAILTLATEHGLDVRRTEMRLQPQAELGLLRYSVAMPLSGTYPQWRAFVEAALANDPALSLDRLQLQRASASAAAVEVDLSWTLWMQAEARTP